MIPIQPHAQMSADVRGQAVSSVLDQRLDDASIGDTSGYRYRESGRQKVTAMTRMPESHAVGVGSLERAGAPTAKVADANIPPVEGEVARAAHMVQIAAQ